MGAGPAFDDRRRPVRVAEARANTLAPMQRRTGGRALGAVLFTDVVGSTQVAAEMGNTRWGELVSRHHLLLRREIRRFGGREVDTAGDGFFVTFERPADAIRCAVAATEVVRSLGIEIRAGVSFGELETVGRKAGGLVVNTAARVMSVAGPGEVLVPSSVKDIVPGSGISFAEHGVHQLKGLEGEYRLFGVTGVDGRELVPPLEVEEAAERRREIFPSRAKRIPLLVGLGVGAVAVIAAAALLLPALLSDEQAPRRATGPLRHSVARIDLETGDVGTPIFLGPGPDTGFGSVDHPLAVGEGGVWVLRPPSLLRIDPLHEEVRSDLIDVGFGQSQTVVTGFDAVWTLSARTLYRIHPGTGEPEEFVVLPVPPGITTWSLSLGDAIWIGVSDGTLVRVDPRTGARRQVETGLSIDGLAATRDGLWVADILAGAVFRFDPDSLRREGPTIEIDGRMDQLIGRGNNLWILDGQLGLLTRIDAISNEVSGSVRVGDDPTDIAVGLDAVWVGDGEGSSLSRADPTTLDVQTFPIGAEVLGVAVDEATESVWIYVGDPAGHAAD
jgi:class 3 adenylate cyclase/streptogramin lyase